MDISFN